MDETDGLGDGFGYTEPNWGKDCPNRPIVYSQRWHDNHALSGDAVQAGLAART